jgi:hypothetical protein
MVPSDRYMFSHMNNEKQSGPFLTHRPTAVRRASVVLPDCNDSFVLRPTGVQNTHTHTQGQMIRDRTRDPFQDSLVMVRNDSSDRSRTVGRTSCRSLLSWKKEAGTNTGEDLRDRGSRYPPEHESLSRLSPMLIVGRIGWQVATPNSVWKTKCHDFWIMLHCTWYSNEDDCHIVAQTLVPGPRKNCASTKEKRPT